MKEAHNLEFKREWKDVRITTTVNAYFYVA